ncbi:MAG: LamG domain-containing protein, partial [Pirellula sp.]
SGWHHIAAVRSDKVLKLYIDGSLVGKSTEFDPELYDLSNQSELLIGFGAQNYYRGRIADVKIYRGELTPEQIREQATQNR